MEFNNIRNINLWGPHNFHKKLKKILKEPCVDTINIYAEQEFEISPTWDQFSYYRKLEKFSKEKTLNIYFGCWNSTLRSDSVITPKHANVYFNPKFWLTETYKLIQYWNCQVEVKHLEKLFLSLNTQPHLHRCKFIDYIKKHDLMDSGNISWHSAKNNSYDWKYWSPRVMTLDSDYEKNLDSYKTIPAQFDTTFMSLISESTLSAHFITEKTWMPVFFKKPFLIWGPHGIHKKFQSLGFKLYDTIFDYSFDSIKNEDTRLDMMMEEVKKIKNKDLNELRQSIIDVIEFNYNHAIALTNDLHALQQFKI